MSTIYRYKLADMTSEEKQRVMSGVLLYSYKWSYSKNDYDFPASLVLKEDAISMVEFENKDRSRKIDRIRAVHAEVPVLEPDSIMDKEELPLEEIDEPMVEFNDLDEFVDYTKFNKAELLGYLKKKGFTFTELKGKTKKSLLELADLDNEVDDEN